MILIGAVAVLVAGLGVGSFALGMRRMAFDVTRVHDAPLRVRDVKGGTCWSCDIEPATVEDSLGLCAGCRIGLLPVA